MSNGRDSVIPISQEDVQKALKLEKMIQARVSLPREPQELQVAEGSQAGVPVTRSEQRAGVDLETVDAPVRGVLIYRKSALGAVRFFGNDKDEVINVVTGPQEQGYTLIQLEEGEHCRILGTPTIQLFQKL